MTQLTPLLVAQIARLQGGVVVSDGIPYIHAIPALREPTDDPLGLMSNWRCPHCNSRLARESFICLNGCHTTTPQWREFQGKLAEAQHRVDLRNSMLAKLRT